MSDQGFRPRYKFLSSLSIDEVRERVKAKQTDDNPDEILVRKVRGHLVLDIPNHQRHFWSPHLDITLEQHDNGQTLVRCLIGPSPTVWTMFMFFYGFFGFMAFVGLTLGLSQWTLGKPMWAWWLVLAALVGMVIMYLISWEGKKLSKDEMWTLKHFVDEALGCDCFALADEHALDENNS